MNAVSMESLLRDRRRAQGRAERKVPPRPMTKADICNVEPITADDLVGLGDLADLAVLDVDNLEFLCWQDRWTVTEGGASWAE